MTNSKSSPRQFDPRGYGSLPAARRVSPAEAQKIIESRKLSSNIHVPSKMVEGPTQPTQALGLTVTEGASGAPSILEQARALNRTFGNLLPVDLIFEFVYENIEFIPNYGLHKGAYGTLIDGCGNAFDQCDLMVQLLRAAGYTEVYYVIGVISLTSAQWSNWLNISASDIATASQLLSNGGIGNAYGGSEPAGNLALNHCWVQVNINGTNYVFDPAFKTYNYTSGVDIATAMQYNRTTFLSDANSGSTLTADYVQNINGTNINTDLTTCSTNLVNWIKQNMPGASMDQILGGRAIAPVVGPVRQTQLPYQDPNYTPVAVNVVPNNYKCTLEVQYGPNPYYIDQIFYTADIYGQRMTIWFDGNNIATLNVNGAAVVTSSTAQSASTAWQLNLVVNHPYAWEAPSNPVMTAYLSIVGGVQTTIGLTLGVCSNQMAAVHQEAQNESLSNGVAATAESMLGQSLLLIWDNFTAQGSAGTDIIGRMGSCYTCLHQAVGAAFQMPYNSGYYKTMDFQCTFSTSALTTSANTQSNAFTTSLLFQALEGPACQQVTGISSYSSTGLIQVCNSNSTKIYNATSSNWQTGTNVYNVMSTAGYPSTALTDVTDTINAGWRVAMPDAANIHVGSLTDVFGYVDIGSNNSSLYGLAWLNNVPYKGALSTVSQTDSDTNTTSSVNARPVNGFGLPNVTRHQSAGINLLNGRYEYSSTDLSVGNQGMPYELSFVRSYNSALRLTFQGMGYGWSHSWMMSANTNSDGSIAFGDQQVSAAAPAIAALFAIIDVAASDSTLPINNFVINCLVAQFLANQLVNNTVRVQAGASFLIFTKMPDGTYLPPMGANGACSLTQPGGAFVYTTPEQVKYTYSSTAPTTGLIESITYPFGVTLQFTYSGTSLTKVSNGFRSLNFAYDQYGQLNTINDGNGRTVTLTVDYATGNLTAVQDPVGNTTTYQYATGYLLTEVFKPANPTAAVVTNVYDSLSRLKQQADAYGNQWTYYLAGSRTEEVSPASNSRVIYYDGNGGPIRTINALGQETDTEYDGNERLIKITLPEGNGHSVAYDADGNVLSMTLFAKPGSGLANRTTTFTYDSTWTSQVATVTDAANNTTTNTYAASGSNGAGKLIKVQLPAVGAGAPISNFTYNSTGQLTTSTDPTGHVLSYSYDPNTHDMLSSVIDPGGLNITANFTYDAVGNLLTATDPKNQSNVTTFAYDKNRRVTEVTGPAPLNQQFFSTYDANGNVIQTQSLASTDPNTQTAIFTYTLDDQVATAVGPANFADGSQPVPVRYAYDNLRRQYQVTDPTGIIASTQFDQLSRVISSAIDGVTQQTVTYTENGKVLTVADAKNNTTTYAHDGFDRLVTTTYPDSSTETASYDVVDNVLQAVTRLGTTFTFTYDALGELLTKTPQGGVMVTLTYDLAGRPLTASTPVVPGDLSTGTFSFAYDNAGRVTTETYPDGKQVAAVSIDADGNVQEFQYTDGSQVNGNFDALNQLTSIKVSNDTMVGFNYDSASRLTGQINKNNTGEGFWFDKDDNLLALSIGGLQPNQSLGTPSRVDFSYNVSDLAQVIGKRCNDSNFVWEPQLAVTTTYGAANDLNQYPSINGTNLTYDENGNLTYDGTNTYTYDVENKLLSVTTPSATISYKYDPLGRLAIKTIGSSTFRYIYTGLQRVEERDGSDNLIRRYVYGDGLDSCLYAVDGSGNITYLHYDEIGSTVLTTDQTGTPINLNVYTPWGELASGSLAEVPVGFTGQFFDSDAGLYYYKARYYSPSLGRFLQPDPVGYASGMNMYEYCGSDPINRADPLGLFWGFDLVGGLGGLVSDIASVVGGVLDLTLGGNHHSSSPAPTLQIPSPPPNADPTLAHALIANAQMWYQTLLMGHLTPYQQDLIAWQIRYDLNTANWVAKTGASATSNTIPLVALAPAAESAPQPAPVRHIVSLGAALLAAPIFIGLSKWEIKNYKGPGIYINLNNFYIGQGKDVLDRASRFPATDRVFIMKTPQVFGRYLDAEETRVQYWLGAQGAKPAQPNIRWGMARKFWKRFRVLPTLWDFMGSVVEWQVEHWDWLWFGGRVEA